MSEQELNDKVAVITGGAGAIGRAIAQGFREAGARIALMDNRKDALDEVAGDALALDVDIRDTQAVDTAFAEVEKQFGRVDILVNNAAVTLVKPIDQVSDDDIDAVMDTNLKGYIKCTRAAVAMMKRLGTRGALLFVSSKNGLEGASDKTLYSAAKGGELTFARALARELGPFGIRSNAICPDAVHEGSHLWQPGGAYARATAKRYDIREQDIPEYYRNRCALKVNITARDVAEAALFLCSGRSAKITGSILTVDGGVAFVR